MIDEPRLYDFMIAVEKVETSIVRVRDDMRRGWEPIEQRAVELVAEDLHHPWSTTNGPEFRMSGSWIATEKDQFQGEFQMRPGYCRVCGRELADTDIRPATTVCESCERKTTEPDTEDVQGLYAKYLVFKNDGDPLQNMVTDCFVLRPTSDDAAYQALWQYVDAVEPTNPELAEDLRAWLYKIADENRKNRDAKAAEPEKQG